MRSVRARLFELIYNWKRVLALPWQGDTLNFPGDKLTCAFSGAATVHTAIHIRARRVVQEMAHRYQRAVKMDTGK